LNTRSTRSHAAGIIRASRNARSILTTAGRGLLCAQVRPRRRESHRAPLRSSGDSMPFALLVNVSRRRLGKPHRCEADGGKASRPSCLEWKPVLRESKQRYCMREAHHGFSKRSLTPTHAGDLCGGRQPCYRKQLSWHFGAGGKADHVLHCARSPGSRTAAPTSLRRLAYQGGAYEALHEAGIEPDWVIGTSSGAISASIIAGNPPDKRLERLREVWRTFAYIIRLNAPYSKGEGEATSG
jgi:Patatin-like phospholipase